MGLFIDTNFYVRSLNSRKRLHVFIEQFVLYFEINVTFWHHKTLYTFIEVLDCRQIGIITNGPCFNDGDIEVK